MSIFNQKSKFKVKAEIRTVRQAVEPPKKKPAQPPSAKRPSSARVTPRASPHPSSASLADSTNDSLRAASDTRARKRRAGASPANNHNNSPSFSDSDDESDGDEDWEGNLDARKRQKRAHQERRLADPNRKLRHPRLWAGEDPEAVVSKRLPIIHASDVASVNDKCQPVLGLAQNEVGVRLQYPGPRHPERYELVWGKDKIEAVKDIMEVVNYVASTYLTDDEAHVFLDQNTGIYRRLEKSKNTKDGAGFKAALKEYNERLFALQKKGVIAKNLDAMHGIPRELVAFILDQVYDRTVAPNVELLAKYENGTDNVYGELLHPFISDMLERTSLTSDKVFVDLGSGVGNVVLQAALETGCESWGCEMMENACNLAEAQQKEFSARCRLWGIASGKVHLERGDFRKNDKILAALKRADIVLVNNQAFTSQLNDNLVNMFLDLRPGCKIISLKTFVHDNKLAENDVATSILDVEHLTYPEEYVSWTSASGTYCISTRKG
ncbi:histone-lysine N-methyltransferase, H3 lysine-79 specific [Lasiosphaeria hispida]|uniref:Histone-lysine N-methyltransferase, H3 lysine-79 specific n=1 Tax=Lasiosphaeria hispida TaxID=260671 RepID=A0AAJ0HM19_9PEZI|nr:histone-lysine N-methyltransferase, H3 lysine-79 specific [Lasiosphaeria hispida]